MKYTSDLNKELDKFKEKKRDNVHSFHKYYGKIIPAIAEWAMEKYTKEGDTVYDPFSGSATVGVEALNLNRNFIGTEISPMAFTIGRAKTNRYNEGVFIKKLIKIKDVFSKKILEANEVPFIVNPDHWFDKKNLVEIKVINSAIDESVKDKKYKHLFKAIASSVVKNASYADPSHVFPGKSKRMREKIESGYVAPSFSELFFSKAEKMPKKFATLFDKENGVYANILNISANEVSREVGVCSVDLIVTNPPYVSSIRYEEATKLEMYAMEYISSQDEFLDISKKYVGTEKFGTQKIENSRFDFVNALSSKMSVKNANTVNRFFTEFEKIVVEWNKILKPSAKVVIKIGDSVLSKEKIPTAEFISKIAGEYGFKTIHLFQDEIGARSFTKYRNSYSGIILHDNILVMEKAND